MRQDHREFTIGFAYILYADWSYSCAQLITVVVSAYHRKPSGRVKFNEQASISATHRQSRRCLAVNKNKLISID